MNMEREPKREVRPSERGVTGDYDARTQRAHVYFEGDDYTFVLDRQGNVALSAEPSHRDLPGSVRQAIRATAEAILRDHRGEILASREEEL